jgi:hypothetical protein
MKAPTWTGVVSPEGKLTLDSQNGFKAYVRTFAGKEVDLVITKHRYARSRNQNSFWWAVVVPMFAEACGYAVHEHEAVHDELVRVLVGMKPESNPTLQIRQSTTDLSTEQFNELIEAAQIFGAEKLGLVIPDPDKEWRRQKARRAA